MKRLFGVLFISASLISCNNRIESEGSFTADRLDISLDSNVISVESTMKLTLSNEVAEGEINIITNENIHKYIEVVKTDNMIDIQLDSNNYKDLDIRIIASASQFESLKASGASVITVEDVDRVFENYKIVLSGASKFCVASPLQVNSCTIVASGASQVKGDYFIVDDLNIDLSGASDVTMGVNKTISGSLSGASSLSYWGDATVSVESIGASKVEKIRNNK